MSSNNFKYVPCLNEAAEAIASDNRELASELINAAIVDADDQAAAWLMKAWVSDSIQDAEFALQNVLEIEPNNGIALSGLTWVHGVRELAEMQIEAKQVAIREAEELARLEAEELARLEAEEQARLDAIEEARLQAEEEARLEAEEEARLAAEEDARVRTEAQRKSEEARLQSEKRARIDAEAEAQRLQKEESRLRAEADAQQAKEDARFAEEQKQIEADEKARLQAEEDARLANEEAAIEKDIQDLTSEVRQEVEPADTSSIAANFETPAAPIKPVVLAVDDSPTVRKLVSLTLSNAGFEVVTAADGFEALHYISENLPDIILSDINMPKLNGYKLCKFVKKHERTQSIPVVMLSGKDGVFDKMRGKLSGCDDFIAKPFESAELISKVRQHLAAVAKN